MSEPRYHVKTTSGYRMDSTFGGGSQGQEVDAYVMDRHYNNAVVATFRRVKHGTTIESVRDYVSRQAQAVADVLNKLDA